MFENELREEEKAIRELQNNVRGVILNYESQLKTIQRDFSKVNGVTEKKIDDLILELEKSVETMLKDFKKSVSNQDKEYKEMISKQEQETLKTLEDYKKNAYSTYKFKLENLFVVKGEL